MTKYFDLLRKHQQQKIDAQPKVDTGAPAVTTTDSSMGNPYSTTTHAKMNHGLHNTDIELIDEQDTETNISVEPKVSFENLLVDEEGSSPAYNDSVIQTADESQLPMSGEGEQQTFHVATWLRHMSKNIQSIFQLAEQQKPTDLSFFDEPLRNLLHRLEQDLTILDALELEISRNIKNICDTKCSVSDLIEKAIMMMLYTIKIGKQLKLQHQEILHYTVAAMLHHIGMATVAHDIRHKSGKLTKDEISAIRKAPANAVAYLKSCQTNNDNILLAASQSAERYDGSGITSLSGHSIALIARIVGLLSMFEALIHVRPYRQRLLPRDAIRELVNHHKKAFDPVLLKALIEAVSLYPVGTFVQLNTGEIGQVIVVHNKFPLRPIVYINMDKYGNNITEREINLKQQPNLMIQKCMYEESLKKPEDSTP